MGASSWCCFCNSKEEESPSTAVDVVAGLQATTTSTSGGTEYYSERCKAMMRSRGQFPDDTALEIEFSKPHWSEVSRREVAQQSAEAEELNRENREVCQQMEEKYPLLFQRDTFIRFNRLGRMIAKGGQAEIYEIVEHPHRLMKVFHRGTSLRDLKQSWPLPVLHERVPHCILWAGMLEDGRFAFVMHRFWGDLRKLIDQAMQHKNVDGIQCPPFPYNKWEVDKGCTFHSIDFMLGVAVGMRDLHENGISHRDLKASNVLLGYPLRRIVNALRGYDHDLINIADFECSIGVLGTGYWRAPEILVGPENTSSFTSEQWKEADVYSYGMVCFEIVTGRVPFDGELGNTKADRKLVIEGQRPELPSDLDDAMKELITKCWAPNPSLRPTFSEIVDTISTKQCEFRLFGIDDELPPQYRLATIQEVREYGYSLWKAMLYIETANLENGSVDGPPFGLKTRLEKQSNASHKLARRHH